MLPTNSMLEAHGRGMAAPTRAATAPGSSGATNRGPSLFSEAECKAWRERIKQETMTSGRLRIMLQDKEKARIKRVTEPYSFKHFPMPPTQYAVMMKRLNTPGASKPRSQIINFFCSSHPCTCVPHPAEARLASARNMKSLRGDWPHVRVPNDIAFGMTQTSDPPSPSGRPTPWRPNGVF